MQVFNRGRRGGRYWFSGGLNWRAVAAWLPASAFGLLFANTTLYIGPFNSWFGDVDVGCIVSGVLAGIAYVVLLAAFPEDRQVFGPRGSALGRSRGAAPQTDMTMTEQTEVRP
jgi:cytosine/uracil/thiamine/allantoin permease